MSKTEFYKITQGLQSSNYGTGAEEEKDSFWRFPWFL